MSQPSASQYQPRFAAWLSAVGYPPDIELAALPRSWRWDFMAWCLHNRINR